MKSFRRLLRVLGILSIAFCSIANCEAQAPPLRILPLGDSLTSGTINQGAYRNKLYTLLTDAGYNVDFVGTQTDDNNLTLPDRNHQGMGGYRIDQIRAGLSSWLSKIEDPDVVLLMIGTNDFFADSTVAEAQSRLDSLVTEIATMRPFAKIIVANLLIRTDSASAEALQSGFNATIPGIVSNQAALGRQVSFVDMHSVLVPADLAEGVHPTPSGFEKVAAAWFPAITNVITPLGSNSPPGLVRTGPAIDLQHITVTFSKPLADASENIANFSLNGGLTISQAVLDPVTKRTVTLTTSTQTPGKLYTLTVTGVRDRTPQQNLIAPGSTVFSSSFSMMNGSFENGASGWTLTGNAAIEVSTPPYSASAGVNLVAMNSGQSLPNATVTQSFPTIPGQTYVLDFDFGVVAFNFTEQKIGVEITGANPLLSQIESEFGNGSGTSVWTQKTYIFTANSTTTTLTFRDQSTFTDSIDLLLDNVRVTAIPNTSNTAPVFNANPITGNGATQGVAYSGSLAGSASDPDAGDLLAYSKFSGPAWLSVAANGALSGNPGSGDIGANSFTIKVTDSAGAFNVATLNIQVTAPLSSVLINGSFEIGSLISSTPFPQYQLTGWTLTGETNSDPVSGLPFGFPALGGYVPTDGGRMALLNGGTDKFGGTLSQSFTTIPGAVYTLRFDAGILVGPGQAPRQQLLGVTVSNGASLLSQDLTIATNAEVQSQWTANEFSFTATGTSATLTFTDKSDSAALQSDLLLDNVIVSTTAGPLNTAPVAVADSYSTDLNTTLLVATPGVLSNDTDAQNNTLTAVISAGPAHGNLTLNPDGGFAYNPSTGYTGPDSFTYQANDGSLNSNIATVSITVNSVNTAPVAVADSLSTNQNTTLVVPAAGVLTNDTDAQSNALSAILNSSTSHGSLSLNANGGFTYTPVIGYTGPDSFTYHANDGSLNSNIATVSITVNPVNTAPVALDDSYSINKNSMLLVSAAGVLTNDTDAQSNPLTAVLGTGPIHGTLALNSNGSFTYTPATDYTGPDSFTYRANDGSLNSNVATVSITVSTAVTNVLVNGSFESDYTAWTKTGNQAIATYPTTDGRKLVAFNGSNLAPNGVLSQTFATVSGQTYTLTFDAGILSYVKKNQTLEVKIAGPGSLLSQTITLKGDGDGIIDWISKTYTFVAGSSTATITFRDRSTATTALDLLLDNVRISGLPAFPNSAPVAAGDVYSVNKNTALVIPPSGVLTNDSDPQSDTLTAVLDSSPAQGTLVLNPNGGFTYTPTTGFVGSDSFTYHASDSVLNSNIATVSISVNEVAAGILVNPSFESGFNGWTTTGNQSIEFYPTTDGIKMVAFNGQNLTPNAVLSQTFATTIGKTYSLNFDTGVFSYTTDPQSLQVTINGTASLLTRSVILAGTGGGSITWAAQSLSFTADSASTTLTFRDQSTATVGIDLLLDNVRVNPLPSPSISSFVTPPQVEEIPTPSLTVSAGNATVSMLATKEGDYVFERSEDLVTWEVTDSGYYGAGESVEFHDNRDPLSTEPLKQRMFYRIRVPYSIPGN